MSRYPLGHPCRHKRSGQPPIYAHSPAPPGYAPAVVNTFRLLQRQPLKTPLRAFRPRSFVKNRPEIPLLG